jgi:hypothetical protein
MSNTEKVKAKFKIEIIKAASVAALISIGFSACTKSRPDQYPDGTVDTPMSKLDVTNAKIEIKTASQPLAMDAASSLRAENEGTEVQVAGYSGPDVFAPMFKDLTITARPGSLYTVRFALDRQFITAYKEVPNPSELTTLETALASQFASTLSQGTLTKGRDTVLVANDALKDTTVTRVPIFQYKLEAFGVVDHAKNDLNEQTNTLRLDQTEWSAATNIQVSTRESDRLPIALPIGDADQNRIFLKDRLNGQLFTKEQLSSELQISTSDQNPSTQYYSQIDGTNLTLYRVMQNPTASDPNSPILQEQADAIKTGDTQGMQIAGVLPCTDAAKASLGKTASGSCYMVESFQVAVTPVSPDLKVKDDNATNEIEYRAALKPNQASLVRIALMPAVIKTGPTDKSDLMDPTKTLIVDQMKGPEFLMTRTLTDSPSSFGDLFMGFGGKLEIVRFVFDKDRVRVIRSQPLVARQGMDKSDLETMMSIPATYFVLSNVADDGTELATPVKKNADFSTPGAIALLDWTKNEVPESSSPLDYYGIDQCFDKQEEPEVSEVNYDKKAGALAFTYTQTLQGSRTADCAGIYKASYDDQTVQKNFPFKERISFRMYDGKNDTNVLMDMPFEAQEQLGFGLFTNKLSAPDQYGNTNKVGSEKDLASLWDIRNGKHITYVLAGLPDEGVVEGGAVTREDIIAATQDVIKDLNNAFRLALADVQDPALKRTDDVIQLQIEGVDVPKGQLGDIQRNTIYWVQKQLDSSIFGLAQAQANPRSGVVETSNVYVYGGNFISSVPFYREMAQDVQHYQSMMDPADKATSDAIAQLVKGQQAAQTATPAPAASASASTTTGSASSMQTQTSTSNTAAVIAKTKAIIDGTGSGKSFAFRGFQLPSRFTPSLSPSLASRIATSPSRFMPPSYVGDMSKLTGIFSSEEFIGAQALEKTLESAKSTGALMDPDLFESMIDANLPQIQKHMSATAIAKSQAASSRLALRSKIMKQMQQMGVCAYDRSEVDVTSTTTDWSKWTDKDWVIKIFKPTLAHEIGHTLGLRHNFQGSYDKDNWLFSKDEKTPRAYSSIMDYMVDDHITYDGFGPQDVEALRIGYTGRIQLADGSLASLSDVLKASGATDWYDFKRIDPAKVSVSGKSLRHYDFCTDDDLDGDPTCQQFDKGTTPKEIVDNDILFYRSYYPMRNLPDGNLSLSSDTGGKYIHSIVAKFMPIRKFLDEAMYQIVTGHTSNAEIDPYLEAVVRGLFFFQEVIRTPDVPKYSATNDDRFFQDQNGDGIPVLLERKAIQDIGVPNSNSDELLVRGIEDDKIIATIMLTTRSFGFPRYTKQSLEIAYPEFEKMIFNAPNALELPTVGLLAEMISSNISPGKYVDGQIISTSSQLAVSSTPELRYYTVLGAVANLDADSITQEDNMSVMFRVLGTSSVPAGMMSLTTPGASGEGELNFWAPTSAIASDVVVHAANGMSQVVAIEPKLKPLLAEWAALKYPQIFSLTADGLALVKTVDPKTTLVAATAAPSPVPAPSVSQQPAAASAPAPLPAPAPAPANPDLASIEQQIDALLAQLPKESGVGHDPQGKQIPLTSKDLSQEIEGVLHRGDIVSQYQARLSAKDANTKDNDVKEVVQALQNLTQWESTNIPTFGGLLAVLSAGDDGSPAALNVPATVSQILPSMPVDVMDGLTVESLKVLDQVYVAIHPEALREYK